MKEEDVKILQRLSKQYKKKGKLIKAMFAEIQKMGYNIKDFEILLKEFYTCY